MIPAVNPAPLASAQVAQDRWCPQLDGLRAIAVTFVLIHHWISPRLGFGIIGVQLFFVLSGFLITGILLRERRGVESGRQSIGFSVRQFYARRFLRIFPLYYACLALFVVLDRFEIRKSLVWFACYLSNVFFFLKGEFGGPFSHFWSLAVEEQFYLFWPWIVLLAPRKRLLAILVGAIVLAPLTRLTTFLRNILHVLHLPGILNFGVIGLILLYLWTIAVASLTWFLFEKPINGLKRYFPYRESPRLSAFAFAPEVRSAL